MGTFYGDIWIDKMGTLFLGYCLEVKSVPAFKNRILKEGIGIEGNKRRNHLTLPYTLYRAKIYPY